MSIESEAAMDNAAAGFLDAAYLAESTASELTAAADYLGRRGNTAVARALLRESQATQRSGDSAAGPRPPAQQGDYGVAIDQAGTINGSARGLKQARLVRVTPS